MAPSRMYTGMKEYVGDGGGNVSKILERIPGRARDTRDILMSFSNS